MASIGQENALASETTNGADVSALVAASRIFQDKFPLATLTHFGAFLTTYELSKGAGERGIELKQLQLYLSTGRNREVPMPKSTFSRIMRTLSVNEGAFSYTTRDKGFGLIEIFQLDRRSKAVRITQDGHDLVNEMTDAGLIIHEREYFNHMIDQVQHDNDFAQSEEMQLVVKLFEEGKSYEEVERLVEEWKKDNPDKVYTRRGEQSLDMPVPEGVTSKWLEKYENLPSDEARQAMLKDAGLFVDETMTNMMATVRPTGKGQVTFTIPRDLTRNKNLQRRMLRYIQRVREMEQLKKAEWDMKTFTAGFDMHVQEMPLTVPKLSRLAAEQAVGRGVRRDVAEHDAQQVDALRAENQELRADIDEMKAMMKQLLEQKKASE